MTARRGVLRGDRGSASALVVAVVAVTVTLAGWLGLLASAQAARGRAQAAADLAALAAARRVLDGRDDACGLAAQVVVRNGSRLAACADEGIGVVSVQVTVPTMLGDAQADARAGPRAARGDPPAVRGDPPAVRGGP